MANEISVSASLSASKNGASVRGSQSTKATLAGTEMHSSVQHITDGGDNLSFGGIDSCQYLYIENLDDEVSVLLEWDSVTLSNIPPGGVLLVPNVQGLPGIVIAGTASDAAGADLWVVAVEN